MLLNLVRTGGLRRSVAIVASLGLLLAPASVGSASASAGGGDTARTGNTTANAPVGAPPTIVVTSSLNASFYLQLVTFTATVTPLDATGTVTFMDGAATLGTATLALSGGVNSAALAFTDLSIGSHPITAVYGGVTSAVLTQAVDTTKLKLIKVICPSYTDVPANELYDTLAADNTGGHTAELNHSVQTTLTAESDKPANCQYAAGWTFNLATDFTSKSENTPLGTATTGADGTVTIDLDAAQLVAARHGGGPTALSVWETTKPDYGFGGIRCYTDILYSDNQDAVYDLPIDATQIYCMAFNVPVLTLTKTPSPTKYDSTTGTVTYSYTVKNTGGPIGVALATITVTDDKINANSPFSCGPGGTTLAYGESVTCTASYTILPGDLTAGSVKNTATAHARLVETSITSNTVTATIVTKPTLTITASSATMVVGSPIPAITASYSGFVSPDDPSSLTGTVTCTTTATSSSPVGVYPSTCSGATSTNYTIIYVAGTVTVTPTATATVTPTLVRTATATPGHTTTPPPTTVGDGPSGGTPAPILAFLICLAFGGLGLLAVQAQRRTLRR